MWTFITTEGVEPTNNSAERPLRRALPVREMMRVLAREEIPVLQTDESFDKNNKEEYA